MLAQWVWFGHVATKNIIGEVESNVGITVNHTHKTNEGNKELREQVKVVLHVEILK